MTHPQALLAESVDWSAPIEAWNTVTGEVRAVELDNTVSQPGYDGLYTTKSGQLQVGVDNKWWKPSGQHNWHRSPWQIRNVAPQPETVPVDKAVWQRVAALVGELAARRTAQIDTGPYIKATDLGNDAQVLHKLLSPVDPDRAEAERIAAEWYGETAPNIAPLLAAIKRGRALATHPAESGTTSAGER